MKLRFDSKSLRYRIWVYFALFAALLMVILWFLQIFFLKTYYQEMKIVETGKIAKTIKNDYGEKSFLKSVASITFKSDLYIHIETSDGTIIFSPATEGLINPSFQFIKEMPTVRAKLEDSTANTVSIIMPETLTNTNTLAYGTYLDRAPGKEVILYIFSPLYPVESTVDILANQLKYVTMISLILAFALSFFISKRITKPIINITNNASELADGNYDVTFEGGNFSEIRRLADTLNYTSKELAKADNLQKDLIANVSHDLRTPLTMVKSYAEMIRDLSGDNPDKRNAHLKVIIDEADRLNLLVGDLLLLSKIQSGVESLNIKVFNMKETILTILESYDIYRVKEGYRFEFLCEEDIWVKGDEARIKQVVSNLLNNAVRYSNEEKTVILALQEMAHSVRCEIKDFGRGIPDEELEHIWERYYKVSTNHSRNTNGTGLGLSIVKEILLLHKAEFGVESKLGHGSTFWFELMK